MTTKDKLINFGVTNPGTVYKPKPYDTSFLDEANAAWELTWIGGLLRDQPFSEDWQVLPEDPSYDAFSDENIAGYEKYKEKFLEVKNKQHHQFLKNTIDYNNYLREKRNEGGLLPEIGAAFFDPITYTPLTFVRGVGFAQKFFYGGVTTGSIIAATEPIRLSTDPTATLDETASYIGISALLGGTLTGFFGRNIDPAIIKKHGSVNNLQNKTMDDAFDNEQSIFKSAEFDPDSPITYKVKTEKGDGNYKLVEDPNFKKIDEIGNDKFLEIVDNNIIMNRTKLKQIYQTGEYVVHKNPGVDNLPRFKDFESYINFLTRKEHIKRLGGEMPGKNLLERENMLNAELIDQIRRIPDDVGYAQNNKKFIDGLMRHMNDTGSLVANKIKNKDLASQVSINAARLFGDGGLARRGSDLGIPTEHSVLHKGMLMEGMDKVEIKNIIEEGFVKYRKQGAESKKVLDYNTSALGIKISDTANRFKNKLGFGFENPEVMNFPDFNVAISKTLIDPEGYGSGMPQTLQDTAKGLRDYFTRKGVELDERGMFQSQKNAEILKGKILLEAESMRNILPTLGKSKLDNLKREELQKLITEAEEIAGSLDDVLESLKMGIEEPFNPLKKDYFPHRYDQERIRTDLDINDPLWINPTKLTQDQKDMVLNGHAKNDVVSFINDDKQKIFGRIDNISEGKVTIKTGANNTVTVRENKVKFTSPKFDKKMITDNFFVEPKAGLRKILFDHFKAHPRVYRYVDPADKVERELFDPNNNLNINIRVQQTIDNILHESNLSDVDGLTGSFFNSNGTFSPSKSMFMTRKLNIPTKDIQDYLVLDAREVLRTYARQVNNRIAMHDKFGDHHMKLFSFQFRKDFILKEAKSKKDIEYMGELHNHFMDGRDKIYGTFNTVNPNAFFTNRLPIFLRDWAATAQMGKVTASSLPDAGKIIMSHGVENTFKSISRKMPFSTTTPAFDKQIAKFPELSTVVDIALSDVGARVMADDLINYGSGSTTLGRGFNRFVQKPMRNLQGYLYHINGLTAWTYGMKKIVNIQSLNRLLQDSEKWANGTLDEFGQKRLLSFGIDKFDARAMTKLGILKFENNKLYAPSDNWKTSTRGQHYLNKLNIAKFQDQQRTIITPTQADKPNMMFGVIRIQSDDVADVFNNPFGRWIGFEKTAVGGKINNGFLALPFQYFAWAFAANQKLFLSGIQGREANYVAGALSMVALAMMGDYLKNPNYWKYKDDKEKIYRAIEMSGIGGLPLDMNFIMEQVSEGMFDTPLGVRPMFDMKPRWGDPETADAIGEVTGAGPGMVIDIFDAFMSDNNFDEKSNVLRRAVPYGSMLWWDDTFKSIWKYGEDLVR